MSNKRKIGLSILFIICGVIVLNVYRTIYQHEKKYGKPTNISDEYKNLIRSKFRNKFVGPDYNIPSRWPVAILSSSLINDKNEPRLDKIVLIHRLSSHNEHIELVINSVKEEVVFDKDQDQYLSLPFNINTNIAKSVRQAYQQINLNIVANSIKIIIDTDSLKYIAANFKQATLYYDDAKEPDIILHASPDSVLPINIALLKHFGKVYFIAGMSIYHAVPLDDDFLHQILLIDTIPAYHKLHDSDFIQNKQARKNRRYSVIK